MEAINFAFQSLKERIIRTFLPVRDLRRKLTYQRPEYR